MSCQFCGSHASLHNLFHPCLLLVSKGLLPAVQELGADATSLQNCNPLPDFGGGHPDVSLPYCSTCVALHTYPAGRRASEISLLLPSS